MATRLSDSDMAVAAAYASGEMYRGMPQQQQRKPRARSVRTHIPEEEGDLPNIDDLQIAAGAAAGKKDPVWPVLRKALGEEVVSDEESEEEETNGEVGAEQGDEEMPAASSEDEDEEAESEEGSSEAESSDTSSSSSDEELIDRALPVRQTDQHVDVGLEVDATGHVRLQLGTSKLKDRADDMEVLRAELDGMEHGGEDADEAHMEQGISLPAVEPLDVEVLPDDVLLPVGCVSAVVGPTIVVQAPENGRAVSEGTPLCLGDRQLVGKVEDVFGPVMEPLYSLRYACGPKMPSDLAVGAQMFCIQRLTEYILPQELYMKGYDRAEEDAESEVDEDEDADGVEFSDDESEAAWRRQQRAAEPPKRRMPQSGPAYVLPTGSERGRGRSQRGRFDGQARGPGRGRMQGRDGAEGGRGRGHSSNGRGRGNPLNGRAGRSAPFQNGQGRHTQFQNGMNRQVGNQGNFGRGQHMADQQPVYANQQQNSHQAYNAQQQQQQDVQLPYSAGPHQQQPAFQQQQQQQLQHLFQQQQPQQQPFQQMQQTALPSQQSGMQMGQYLQSPPSGQPQTSWNHQSTMQQPTQGMLPVPQNMTQSYAPVNTQSQPRNPQQQHFSSPYGQQQVQQQSVMPAPQQWPQQQAMPGLYQGQPHLRTQLPQQQHQQQFQQQQHAALNQYYSSMPPQQSGQPQMGYQGLLSPPSAGGAVSSPATNAYLARLHGRPSKPGNGTGR